MEYSAGIMSYSFWFLESKKTVEYILEGLNKKEFVKLSVDKNIFQAVSDRRSREMANYLYRRFEKFPKEILNYFLNVDINSAKIFVLIATLQIDKLFFEFMYEVFREKIILGNLKLENKDFNIFFQNKMMQSEKVANWKEKTIKSLKSVYLTMLKEAGVIDNEKNIKIPFLDMKLKNLLIKNGYGPFVYSITGDQ
ncbi:hypothetical protein BGI41_00865 [Methanobrevibacter sp. 87.7]|uniref:DUF1819 family protein n=1 Tax=Methanobrevibacter sp. 87.7 TaxID=387957 RepID=UPI000B510AF1|nr:DUF1819 family protein [Methanobrevibacter sp. 87.7]OWT33744.1 hypothetical protein BGI41_00865 [Methanobrevibacter sp. 87.7]